MYVRWNPEHVRICIHATEKGFTKYGVNEKTDLDIFLLLLGAMYLFALLVYYEAASLCTFLL